MWFAANGSCRLFHELLEPLTDHLREVGFVGDMALNCIVNDQGAFPLEATPRFGWPATQLQMELTPAPWGDFLATVARGRQMDPAARPGYGVVILLACPPFPFVHDSATCRHAQCGVPICFRSDLTDTDLEHIHFEGVELERGANGQRCCRLADNTGYVLHVSGSGPTVTRARAAAHALLDKIVIPRAY